MSFMWLGAEGRCFLSVCVLSCFFGLFKEKSEFGLLLVFIVQGARGNTFACDKW